MNFGFRRLKRVDLYGLSGMKVGIVLTLVTLLEVCCGSQQERQLYSQLLHGYNKLVRPVRHHTDPVVVRIRFSLVDVLSVDENNGLVTAKTWITMTWKDEYLTWNPALYSGIKRLNFATDGNNRIWIPDIVVFNALRTDFDSSIQAVVHSDGQVVLVQPAVYTVRCRHEFRGNSWVSAFKVGSWTYDERMLDIRPIDGSTALQDDEPAAQEQADAAAKVDIDTDSYTINDHWALLDHAGRRDVKVATVCCTNQVYVSMHYVLKLRKKLGPSLLG